MRNTFWLCAALLAMGSALGIAPAQAAGTIKCEMDYELAGWSAVYKTAKGSGTVKCDNGQMLKVNLKTTGAGPTIGTTKIQNGRGEFAGVDDIRDVLGDYVATGANAAAGIAAEANMLTQGKVSLALGGTGVGVELGAHMSKFTISEAAR